MTDADPEESRIAAFVDRMLRGEAPDESDDDLAEAVTETYVRSVQPGRGRLKRQTKLVTGRREKDALLDVIMERAYPGEVLSVSLARVGKAAAVLGFDRLTAFSATCAYKTFPKLTEEPLR